MSVVITTNTILRFKSFTNHENERLESHNHGSIMSKERITNVYIKKNDDDRTKLRDYEKENVSYRVRDQTMKEIL